MIEVKNFATIPKIIETTMKITITERTCMIKYVKLLAPLEIPLEIKVILLASPTTALAPLSAQAAILAVKGNCIAQLAIQLRQLNATINAII